MCVCSPFLCVVFSVFHCYFCFTSFPLLLISFAHFTSMQSQLFFYLSPFSFTITIILTHINSCTCFLKLYNRYWPIFFSGLSVFPIIFSLILLLILIYSWKNQLNGAQEQQDLSLPLMLTSQAFQQDPISHGQLLQLQSLGRPNQALPPCQAPPLIHHQHPH